MRQRVDRTDQCRADAHRRGGTQRLEAAHDHEERQTVCEKAQDRGDHEYCLSALVRSEEHTSELQSLMRNSYAVFCLKKKTTNETSLSMTYTSMLPKNHALQK